MTRSPLVVATLSTPTRLEVFEPGPYGHRQNGLSRTFSILAVLLILGSLSCGPSPLRFDVTFDDVAGLAEGHSLVYHGLSIGEVTAITFDPDGQLLVTVIVAPVNTSTPYREADFVIERSGSLFDFDSPAQITMKDRAGPRTPVEPEDTLSGSSSLSHFLGIAGDLGSQTLARLRSVADDEFMTLVSLVSIHLPTSAVARSLLRALLVFLDDLPVPTAAEFRDFIAASLPRVRSLAAALTTQLREEGLGAAASSLGDAFDAWIEQFADETI